MAASIGIGKRRSSVYLSIWSKEKYDLVFANILEHVLISEKPTIVDSVKKGGHLIVSGILNHQVDTIVQTYSHMEKKAVVSKGDWSAILFKDIT